jgi:hypothetical protein
MMSQENQMLIVSLFMGFTIGVLLMMIVNTDTQVGCYKIIQDIEMEVCEECWNKVFEHGERYEEVEYYTTWE